MGCCLRAGEKKSQEGPNLKINARSVIAHYISETVNTTEILITREPNCEKIKTLC